MDTMVTVAGNLVADPLQRVTAAGATVVNLRVAATPRRFDRETMQWRDGDPLFISVTCWRQLAGNVMATLRKGDGVLVHGRLSFRIYDDKLGVRRTQHEIEAVAVGPDLNWLSADLRRPPRPAETPAGAVADQPVTQASTPADAEVAA
jgi:single-strand DNA-binding protein